MELRAAAVLSSSGPCNSNNVVFQQAVVNNFIGGSKPLPTGETVFVIPDGVAMSGAAPDGCQGATFAIPVTLSATT